MVMERRTLLGRLTSLAAVACAVPFMPLRKKPKPNVNRIFTPAHFEPGAWDRVFEDCEFMPGTYGMTVFVAGEELTPGQMVAVYGDKVYRST